MVEVERVFFAAWWSSFGQAPTSVRLLLSAGSDELISAAAAIAPGPGYVGPVSPGKLGSWLKRRSSDFIHLDGTILTLTCHDTTSPAKHWRLRPKEATLESKAA